MKPVVLIIGICITLLGLGMTVYSWYAASVEGKIDDANSYVGPLLFVVGAWRVLASAATVPPPTLFRMVAVGIGIAAGFGNTAALKAAYPGDKVISATSLKH